jgi:hypothetical protein
MGSVRKRLRGWFAWLFRWTTSATEVPPLSQTAWQRAKTDTASFAAQRPIFFGALVTAGVGGVGALAAILAAGASPGLTILAGIGGALAGFFLIILLIAGVEWVLAFPRQRNEARGAVADLEGPEDDPAHLVEDFAAWLRVKKAALPSGGFRQVPGIFPWGGISADTHAQQRRDHEQRQDAVEAIHATARTEYQAQFHDPILALLANDRDAENPRNIGAMQGLLDFARATLASDVHAAWLNRQRERGNGLLDGWSPTQNNPIRCADAAKWEEETYDGLATHAPAQQAHFRHDAGLGGEWFQQRHGPHSYEDEQRAMLRRRLHRLSEISASP